MTDNEIIKALECCNSPFSEHRCKDCPMQGNFRCSYYTINIALDLINRQKAEIERLEKEVKDKEMAYNDEFCLRKEWQTKCRELLKEKQAIKSEAIKEFAESICNGRVSNDPVVIAVRTELECLKEMTEVENEDN